jgi:H+-transporting ATPase
MTRSEVIPLSKTDEKGQQPQQEWKDEIAPEIEIYLDTPPTYGLTHQQVQERLARFGKNELQEKKPSKILHFLSFCKYIFHPLFFFLC